MKIKTSLGSVFLLFVLLVLPTFAFADGSASVGALFPGDTVLVGAHVTFDVITSGFTNPKYFVIDSFGGGVNTSNIDSFGNLSWTPNNSDIGAHTITITVSDSQGDSASASQTVTVVTPNVTVGAISPAARVIDGTPVTFTLSSSGYTNPQYSVADSFSNSSMSSGNTNSTTGVFTWTPNFQDIGTHTLIAEARDYLGNNIATTSQQIVVSAPVSVGVVSIMPNLVHVGDAVSFIATTTGFIEPNFTVSDAFTSTLGTSSLAIDQNGKATWTPASNDIGTHPITVSVTDAAGDSATALVHIQVLPAGPVAYVPVVVPYSSVATSSTTSVAPASYVFKRYLANGSTGSDVTALQKLLLQLGFYTGPVTGYFGNLTKGGVENYQAAHNISTLGVVGPITRAALNSGH